MSTTAEVPAHSPIDVAVIVFDDGVLGAEVAPAIVELHESGTVRVLDMAFVRTAEAGDAEAAIDEIEDGPCAEAFARIDPAEEFDLLSNDDLEKIAVGLEPGSAALVVVWENTWVSRLATGLRESSGRVTSWHRVPPDEVERALVSAQEGDPS